MTRYFLLGTLSVILGLSETRGEAPAVVAATPRNDWQSRHETFLADAKERAASIKIVFLGDSITARWTSGAGAETWKNRYAPLGAINLGISSDATQNVLWRLRNGELADLHPKMVILLIGTNNLLRANPPTVAYGVWSIVDEIRRTHPETRVLVQGIFPRTDRKELGDKIPQVNELLQKLDDGKMVKYVNFGGKFLQSDGTLDKTAFPDGVHPETPENFELWADEIQPIVEQWLTAPPVADVPPPAPPSKPTDASTSTPEARDEWMQMHRKQVGEETKLKPNLLFFGDKTLASLNKAGLKSLFDTTYGKYRPYNFSIVGNRPENLLWEFQNGALESVTPAVVVLQLQDVLNEGTVSDAIEGLRAVIATLRDKLPTARILVLGAFPTPEQPKANISEYNTALAALADNKTVWFLDVANAKDWGTAHAEYPSYHHPEPLGYETWLKIQEPMIENLMNNP